ncbi:NAD(P)HX epimerase [Indibacter alkaliphilus LW1]|uniref:Bifunctional NAD(P)H-hydrate repair enzyme n=1 Tax=Indibacter alkaliphilus (strain CCUG 57479 / KCTC 22604 / LW1) TaxID=1189612 RepID=S2DD04_INDAL|nr:bifunctional ADP-dependent NAD(P)H-hydrate dehydratase/NAD(P)H-hydrate epimerase [Indibacter alkaliphilus]EOZ96809.1 NAD(P)HX epimerase [Indibacter alkaliphilus LW1]
MLSILSGNQVAKLDKAYIQSENISSWELMERAALSFVRDFFKRFQNSKKKIFVFVGPGNNGGDGLAIARLIADRGYKVSVITFSEKEKCSKDYVINFEKLPENTGVILEKDFNYELAEDGIVIDALFGVGINRPLEGVFLKAVKRLNELHANKIAVDIPSGLPADELVEGEAFLAELTVSFQFPKFSLLFPEHAKYIGELLVASIGIPEDFLMKFERRRFFMQESDMLPRHKKFHAFSHKGDFGRILLIGGRRGKAGAIILSARAALRTGSGLVHVWADDSAVIPLHNNCIEAMYLDGEKLVSMDDFDALGIGPGLGQVDVSELEGILKSFRKPLVLDADALNLLSENPQLWANLPENSILTPHLKEFERISGKAKNQMERLEKARSLASDNKVYLVLKGAFTCVSAPDGTQYFNSTGNKHMATAGSGDVLTGMLTAMLGQGYSPLDACLCAVFHHGLAGQVASKTKGRGTIASDIIESIPQTFLDLGID